MQSCPNCGAGVSDGAAFCPSCGHSLLAAGNSTPSTIPQPTSESQADLTYTRYEPVETPQQAFTPGVSTTPAASTTQAKKNSRVLPMVLGIVAFLAAFFFARSLFGGSSSSSSTTPAISQNSQSSSNSSSSSTSSTNSGSYSYTDLERNPTVAAVLELSGSEFTTLIEDREFSWVEEQLWWTSSDQNDAVYVMGKQDYEYTRNEVRNFGVNGQGSPALFRIVVDDRDYSSARSALNDLSGMRLDDEYWVDDDIGIALATSSSGRQNFILVTVDDDIGLYIISVFNPEAIRDGILYEYIEIEGSDAQSVWDAIV